MKYYFTFTRTCGIIYHTKEEKHTRFFKQFINEVNSLKMTLLKSKRKNKHYHLMFGDINTKDWFTLIAFHMAHHEKQKKKINEFLESR